MKSIKPKTVNIAGDPNDIHYRYKRNAIEVKYQTSKGTQTVIQNLSQICEQLAVSQLKPDERQNMVLSIKKHLIKKIKTVYGLVTERKDGTICLQGKVASQDLEAIVNALIKQHLLCKRCGLPEWVPNDRCYACTFSKSKAPTDASDDDDKEEDKNEKDTLDERAASLIKQLDEFKEGHSIEIKRLVEQLIERCWDCETIKVFNSLAKEANKLMSSK